MGGVHWLAVLLVWVGPRLAGGGGWLAVLLAWVAGVWLVALVGRAAPT